jgi:hypothetical protein
MSVREKVASAVKRSLSFRVPPSSLSPVAGGGLGALSGPQNSGSLLEEYYNVNTSDDDDDDDADDDDNDDKGGHSAAVEGSSDDDEDCNGSGEAGSRARKRQRRLGRQRRSRRAARQAAFAATDPALARGRPWAPSEVVLLVAGARG